MRELSESIRTLRQRLIVDMMVAPGDVATCQLRAHIIDGMLKQDPTLEKWFNSLLKVYVE